MNTISIKQLELANIIPNLDIREIEKLLSFARNNFIIPDKPSRRSLEGIWSDLNFENIDLENEIRQLRNSLIVNLDKMGL